ncbi:MAG TPA: hypothetical protein VH278_17220 [Burkholderiaceae bacterium]|nr:hypothetical protein [Burkholderiaceae bacterium]
MLTAPMVDTPPTTRPVAGRSPAGMPLPPHLATRAEPAPGMPGHHDLPGMPTVQ